MDENDKIRRALARITGIRANVSEKAFRVYENQVTDYSDALRHLEEVGYDIAEFQIPPSWMERPIRMTSPTMGTIRDAERSVKRELFLTKVDAVLSYFTGAFTSGSEKESIGFRGPRLTA
jgi:hypothetical protein